MRPRPLLLLLVTVGAFARAPGALAADPPLVAVEMRGATGVSAGGGAGISVWRAAPVILSMRGEYAFMGEPWTSAYGGLLVEAGARVGYGVDGGVRVRPSGSRWRIAGGGRAVIAPYTVFGPTFTVGACGRVAGARTRVCADGEIAAFLWGSDLPSGRVAGQALLALGVEFDAW